MPHNGKIRKWRKRVRGTPAQQGKAFPIFEPSTIQTAGRGFKEQLRTSARPARKSSPFPLKNPLMDSTDTEAQLERKSPLEEIREATEEKSAEEELREQVAQKILQYMKNHPEATIEEAETEITGTPEERRKTTTQKIRGSISRIFSTLGFGKKPEEEEEDAYVYVERNPED